MKWEEKEDNIPELYNHPRSKYAKCSKNKESGNI